jgi:hypothetical protein
VSWATTQAVAPLRRTPKNYAGASLITRASDKKKTVLAHATSTTTGSSMPLHQQAFCALTTSPCARAHYDQVRACRQAPHAALRLLSNRVVGIPRGCLKTSTTPRRAHRLSAPQPRSANCCLAS